MNLFAVRFNPSREEGPFLDAQRAGGLWYAKPERVFKNDYVVAIETESRKIVGVYEFANPGYECVYMEGYPKGRDLKYNYHLKDAPMALQSQLLGKEVDIAKRFESFGYIKYDHITGAFTF